MSNPNGSAPGASRAHAHFWEQRTAASAPNPRQSRLEQSWPGQNWQGRPASNPETPQYLQQSRLNIAELSVNDPETIDNQLRRAEDYDPRLKAASEAIRAGAANADQQSYYSHCRAELARVTLSPSTMEPRDMEPRGPPDDPFRRVRVPEQDSSWAQTAASGSGPRPHPIEPRDIEPRGPPDDPFQMVRLPEQAVVPPHMSDPEFPLPVMPRGPAQPISASRAAGRVAPTEAIQQFYHIQSLPPRQISPPRVQWPVDLRLTYGDDRHHVHLRRGKWWYKSEWEYNTADERTKARWDHAGRIMETSLGERLHGDDMCLACLLTSSECWVYSASAKDHLGFFTGHTCARCRIQGNLNCDARR
jgi:hypothetical protein